MEGYPEESDEDNQESKTILLWQKHMQQSIFLDLSDDESLHLSDLDRSIDLCVSQSESEPSVNLNMSAELSDLEDTSSDSSVDRSQSDVVVQSRKNSSVLPVSVQRPNTMQEELPVNKQCEDQGQNTSDEEHEDLPYDGHLSSLYFHQMSSPEGNTSSDGTVHASPDGMDLTTTEKDGDVKSQDSLVLSQKDEGDGDNQLPNINQVLLRHLSQEQLLLPDRLIEAESLPDVSLLDSVDDVLHSWARTLNSKSQQSDRTVCGIDLNQHIEGTDDDPSDKETEIKEKNITASNSSIHDKTLDVTKPDIPDEGTHSPKVPLTRTRSFSDIKYGQGQVHYPRPDFSKIAPKVKIPKAPSGPAKPCQPVSSTMHRAQSSPGMLDLISRVLEDSLQPTEKSHIFRDLERQTGPALAHQLQADYDDLLTKCAEAEHVLDEMRMQTNTTFITDLVVNNNQGEGRSVGRNHVGTFAPQISGDLNEQFKLKQDKEGVMNLTSDSQHDGKEPSAGEEMTAELRAIISQFMLTVEEVKQRVSINALSLEEQQMILRNVKEAQDQLERKYMSKKEEHRALEMQNYMGLKRNTGTFDPERLLEGDIFRAGMLLDDIKEMIDKHLCEQDSTPQASVSHKPHAPCMQHSLEKIPAASATHPMHEVHREEEAVTEARSGHGAVGIEFLSELTINPFAPENMTIGSDTLRSGSRVSVFGPQTSAEQESNEEERSSSYSEGIISSNIVACLSGPKSSRPQTPAESHSKQESDFSYDDCDPGGFTSPIPKLSSSSSNPHFTYKHSAPPLTSSTSQVIVSSETDSGFGSSYLQQSGTFQSSLISESRVQNDSLSSSDSDSCSNLRTAIHPAGQSSPQWTIPHLSLQSQPTSTASAAVELWVHSTKKEASVRQQGSDRSQPAHLHQHMSETILSTNMEAAQREGQLCSCNSDAIMALQLEVSRLKQELKEGLVQLPHLAQKMDYLTSKYRQERRSRTRTRNHQRPSSLGKHRSRLNVRVDDWISTDMDPSRSKDIDNDDTGGSESELQFDTSPARGNRGRIISEFRHVLQTLQSSKDGISTENASRLKLNGERINRQRMKDRDIKDFNLDDRWSLISPPSLQRPLLQVNYGSSSSLPASYKYSEAPIQHHHMKRSTQSDSALLPSDVYFLRTPSPATKTGRRRGSKEEDMNRTLDQAIEVARSMKRTTDRMARTLSADLAKAEHLRKLHHNQPPGGGRHHVS